MCPNYWDAHGGDEPGPLNLATGAKELSQDGSFYKFPNQVRFHSIFNSILIRFNRHICEQVEYSADGFREKNKDSVHPDTLELVQVSRI